MGQRGWAIVTGASAGLGYVFVKELVRAGYPVLAVARRKDRLDQLAAEMAKQGGKAEPLAADLGSPEGVKAVVGRATEVGDVELLVNNAGVSSWGYFFEIPLNKHLAMLHLNIEALVSLTWQLLPRLARRTGAGIINVASVVGFQPMPYWTTYAATKAFVLSFSEGIAHELRASGVRVLAVCPGMMKTELYDVSDSRELTERLPALTPEHVVRAALRAYNHPAHIVKVVGLFNFLLTQAGRLTPRFLMRSITGGLLKPKTAPRLLPPATLAR
jgi:short-subunit dehydrogenase